MSVRSPCASSSGVGGRGRLGGPGGNCGGVDGAASSASALKPGLYEIGLINQKHIGTVGDRKEEESKMGKESKIKIVVQPY